MPLDEFFQWMVYAQIEPFGRRLSVILAGILAASNVNLHVSDSSKATKYTDYVGHLLADYKSDQTEYTPEQEEKLMSIFEFVHNAKERHRQRLEQERG